MRETEETGGRERIDVLPGRWIPEPTRTAFGAAPANATAADGKFQNVRRSFRLGDGDWTFSSRRKSSRIPHKVRKRSFDRDAGGSWSSARKGPWRVIVARSQNRLSSGLAFKADVLSTFQQEASFCRMSFLSSRLAAMTCRVYDVPVETRISDIMRKRVKPRDNSVTIAGASAYAIFPASQIYPQNKFTLIREGEVVMSRGVITITYVCALARSDSHHVTLFRQLRVSLIRGAENPLLRLAGPSICRENGSGGQCLLSNAKFN